MAHLYTSIPTKYRGEQRLATQLASFSDERLHLWFGINYLPGVRDIDCILWYEEVGVFVIEVKAVPLRIIESFGYRTIKIAGRELQESPHLNAYGAQEELRRYLRPRLQKIPFFDCSACWPEIARYDWDGYWNRDEVRGDFSKSMLFEEDITGGPTVLKKRLQHIAANPAVRSNAKRYFRHDTRQLERFRDALDFSAQPAAAPSDLEKLRIIEKDVSRRTRAEVPPGATTRILYNGHPGTGKTFRLLQIAHAHVTAGKKVLFVCFNKVLAADIRRYLSYSEQLRTAESKLRVADVFEMVVQYAAEQGITLSEGDDLEEWGVEVARDMHKNQEALLKYDTLLVDEGQDMKQWAFEMLSLHCRPDSTICIVAGKGQELYGGQSTWLRSFAETATQHRLNRNWRNTKPIFQLAQLFYEAELKSSRISALVQRFRRKTVDVEGEDLGFDREDGRYPSVRLIDRSPLEKLDEDSLFYSQDSSDCMVREYKQIIEEQLNRIEANERRMDLLILVPDTTGLERRWALSALERLSIPFIDYTVKANRRDITQPDMVRLCTFHSARGLEGTRVIVFGFEGIESLARLSDADCCNLGYIVLSRSMYHCTLAVQPNVRTEAIRFTETALAELQS
jgi:hypothetical protein